MPITKPIGSARNSGACAHGIERLILVDAQAEAKMEQFPEKWLLVIGKHLRQRMGLSPDAPLPAHIQNRWRKLRESEIAHGKS